MLVALQNADACLQFSKAKWIYLIDGEVELPSDLQNKKGATRVGVTTASEIGSPGRCRGFRFDVLWRAEWSACDQVGEFMLLPYCSS